MRAQMRSQRGAGRSRIGAARTFRPAAPLSACSPPVSAWLAHRAVALPWIFAISTIRSLQHAADPGAGRRARRRTRRLGVREQLARQIAGDRPEPVRILELELQRDRTFRCLRMERQSVMISDALAAESSSPTRRASCAPVRARTSSATTSSASIISATERGLRDNGGCHQSPRPRCLSTLAMAAERVRRLDRADTHVAGVVSASYEQPPAWLASTVRLRSWASCLIRCQHPLWRPAHDVGPFRRAPDAKHVRIGRCFRRPGREPQRLLAWPGRRRTYSTHPTHSAPGPDPRPRRAGRASTSRTPWRRRCVANAACCSFAGGITIALLCC